MTRIRPGEPGHGGNQATLRLRPVLIINGEPVDGWTTQWEIICPACGDDCNLDFRTVSPYLQKVRGPYPSEAEGLVALRCHRGQSAPLAADAPGPAPAAPAAQPDLVDGVTAAQRLVAQRLETGERRIRVG
jgi:hypothetical protein